MALYPALKCWAAVIRPLRGRKKKAGRSPPLNEPEILFIHPQLFSLALFLGAVDLMPVA